MKRNYFVKAMLFALLAVAFTACDNESVEGEFVTDDGQNDTEEGLFVAEVAGVSYTAETTNNVYDPATGTIVISGIKADGEVIVLAADNAGIGTFDLATVEGSSNSAIYFPLNDLFNPYLTAAEFGGSGTMEITALDLENLTVSGNFQFIGARAQLDAEGNPILDGEGNPVIQNISITDGAFNAVPLVLGDIDDGGGGDPDPDPTDPEDSFYALADGSEFVDITLETSEITVAGIDMLNVVATDATGGTIRIDFPKDLGVGTFDLQNISDGTAIIALYNSGLGGENLTSNPGTLTITEFGVITGRIAGTFSFTANDPLNIDPVKVMITEGAFNIDYIEGGIADEVFMADVDGVTYTPTLIEYITAPQGAETIQFISTRNEDTDQSLSINFPSDITAGSFDMAAAIETGLEVVGTYKSTIDGAVLYTSGIGTFQVISYERSTGIMEASFSFLGSDATGGDPAVFEITNGTLILNIPL